MLGTLTHKCTPPQQNISIILYDKVVQLHINMIYANSFQERTDSAIREIPGFRQWTAWYHLLCAARCGKNQKSGPLILSRTLISIYTRRFDLLRTAICYTNVRSTLIYSPIPTSCCEFDVYTKLPAHWCSNTCRAVSLNFYKNTTDSNISARKLWKVQDSYTTC
jgi:hypothetical protein